MDAFGTDALRFYLVRDVPSAATARSAMDAVRARYESELANEYGNLASRTIAMIHRYRDGVVPDVDSIRRSRPNSTLPGAWRSCSTAPSSRTRSNRSGSACGAESLRRGACAVAACPRPRRARPARPTLATLAEAVRAVTVLLHPYMPATPSGCSPRSAPELGTGARARTGGGRTVASLEPLFPKRA